MTGSGHGGSAVTATATGSAWGPVVTGGTAWFEVNQRTQRLDARALRLGLERNYRALARLTPDEALPIELVDMANAIRPGTLT